MKNTYPKNPSMLVTMAHPDDESFGLGGTLAAYARRGVKIHLLCLTDGAVGTVDANLLAEHDSIPSLRLGELRCASEILGLTSVEAGWYRDSGMPGAPENHHPDALSAQPVETVALQIAEKIRTYRPQVVITHDPIGNYRHPDHIATYLATALAFKLAGDPQANIPGNLPPYQPQKLYYNTFPKTPLKILVFMMKLLGFNPHKFGRNKDIDIGSLAEDGDFPIHLRTNIKAYQNIKAAASNCHVSQLGSGPPFNGILGFLARAFATHEYFSCAYPENLPHGYEEEDFFENVSS